MDIIKAIEIITVVAVHASIPVLRWISLFELSAFFVAAGFCYNDKTAKNSESIRRHISNRIKGLYLPCVAFSSICVLMNNLLVELGVLAGNTYSIGELGKQLIKCVLFSGGGQISGTIWFLRCMFVASLLYLLFDYVVYKLAGDRLLVRMVVCLLALVAGWLAHELNLPANQYLNSVTILFCFELGRCCKEKKIRFMMPGQQERAMVRGVIAVGTAACLYVIRLGGGFAVKSNNIWNPIIYFASTVLGWAFLCSVSDLLARTAYIKECFCYIGRNTLPIMLLHFATFKIVTALEIVVLKADWSNLTAHPCYITENGGWLAYTVAGVAVPLFFYWVYSTVRKIIRPTTG